MLLDDARFFLNFCGDAIEASTETFVIALFLVDFFGRETREVALGHLLDGIHAELGMNPIEQMTQRYLPGFSPEEIDQKKRDYESLRARLDRIPTEIEEETRIIQKHYAHPTDRTFPAGVVFLIPM